MTDDYLLQEFHEAGIWLPKEKRRADAQEYASWRALNAKMDACIRVTESRISVILQTELHKRGLG